MKGKTGDGVTQGDPELQRLLSTDDVVNGTLTLRTAGSPTGEDLVLVLVVFIII